MRALVFEAPGRVVLRELEAPQVSRPHEVSVAVHYAGICGTDLGIVRGKIDARPGVVLGHEACGTVTAAGSEVTTVATGQRVVIDPTYYCRACDRCAEGELNFCRSKWDREIGIDRDGAFAEVIVLPSWLVHPLPDGMDLVSGALVEPLACVLNNADATGRPVGADVLVLGGGPVGAIWALDAGRWAARVVVVEADPYRRAFLEDLGLRLAPASELPPDAVAGWFAGRAPGVVVDTTGRLVEAGLGCVRPGGVVVAMGFDPAARATVSPFRLATRGLRLVGAGDYNGHTFPRAIRALDGLKLSGLVTHTVALEDHGRALDLLGPAGSGYAAMKVLFDMRGSA